MRTFVQFEVGGVRCEGMAEHTLPAGGVVPPGWRLACAYVGPADDDGALQSIDVLISPEDRARMVGEHRLADTPAARQEALCEHIIVVEAKVTREVIERRHRRLRSAYVPGWYVRNIVAPTPEQWATLETNADGDFTAEDLVNVGCLPELGAPAGQFQEWLFLQADVFDEARAEELDREKAKETAPYRRYLEQEPLAVP